MAIPLGRSSPSASCDRPERRREGSPGTPEMFGSACRSYLVLLPVGFTLPPPLPAARCALTAPFHPCRPLPRGQRARRCVSVALSLGSPPPGVTRHRASVEPGLSSLRRVNPAKSGHPTVWLGRFGTVRRTCQTVAVKRWLSKRPNIPHEPGTRRNRPRNPVLRSIEKETLEAVMSDLRDPLTERARTATGAEYEVRRMETAAARRPPNPRSTASIAGHPIHPMLIPFPIAFFVATRS